MTNWRLAVLLELVVGVLGPPDLPQPLNRGGRQHESRQHLNESLFCAHNM